MGRKAAKRREHKEAAKQAAYVAAVAPLASRTREDGQSVHEAVHAVAAAVLMGAERIANVTVEPGGAPLGGWLELVDDPELSAAGAAETPLADLPATLIERSRVRLVMHLAGTFDVDVAGGRSTVHRTAYESDRSNAHELALLLADWDEAGTAAILREADGEARIFVEEHQPAIRAVAEALELRRTLSGADVDEILSGFPSTD
jgi:hypothetical protein